ncbi:MAG: sugar ABC transporter permease [Solirubrobacteraceae bacterium]
MSTSAREKLMWGVCNAVIIVCALVPVLWIASLSFKDPATIGDKSFFPSKWSTANYSGIFDTSEFTDALRNSIGIALITTVIAVTLACMAAYAIARLNFPGKFVILSGALAIAMFPPISIVGPLFNIWREVGLYDTWPGLIIPYMTFSLPLAIYTLSAFFREIPWELEQAAQVDGATPFQAFRRVLLPMAVPILAVVFVLAFIYSIIEYPIASVLLQSEQQLTLAVGSRLYLYEQRYLWGDFAAAAVLSGLPITLVFLLAQRWMVSGITAGGLKG